MDLVVSSYKDGEETITYLSYESKLQLFLDFRNKLVEYKKVREAYLNKTQFDINILYTTSDLRVIDELINDNYCPENAFDLDGAKFHFSDYTEDDVPGLTVKLYPPYIYTLQEWFDFNKDH